jgi:hypothetical protein
MKNQSSWSYDQALPFYPVNEPMRLINPLRPPSRKLTFQRLWFTSASKRIPFRFLDQSKQPFGHLGIRLNPILQVLEGPLLKFQAHASNPPSFQTSNVAGF